MDTVSDKIRFEVQNVDGVQRSSDASRVEGACEAELKACKDKGLSTYSKVIQTVIILLLASYALRGVMAAGPKRADCRIRWWVKFTSGTSLVVATASSICSIWAPSLVQGNLGKWIATAAAGVALVTGFAHLAVSKRSEFHESWTINGLGTVYPYNLSEFQGFQKRDSIDLNVTGASTIDGIGSNMPGIVTLDSANNSHIAITIGDYSIGEMLQDISEVEPYLPSNDTTSTNSTALAKRRNYYGVSWKHTNADHCSLCKMQFRQRPRKKPEHSTYTLSVPFSNTYGEPALSPTSH